MRCARRSSACGRCSAATFDLEQAKAFGIANTVLDRIVSDDLMTLEEQRLKLLVGDQVVRDAIFANPAFHGLTGTFDRNVFNNILATNHFTEDRYVALLRRDIARSMLTGAVTGGAMAPSELTDPLYQTRNEKRVADTVFIPSDKVTGIADPTDAELQEFHDKRQDLFRSPEYRGFTALLAKPDDIAAGIEVPESKLREEYQSRLDEFQTPERRDIEQILVPDEAKANEAATAARRRQGLRNGRQGCREPGRGGDQARLRQARRDAAGARRRRVRPCQG